MEKQTQTQPQSFHLPTQYRAYSLTANRYCIGTLSIKESKYFIEEYGTTHEVDKQTVEEKYF